MALSSKLYHRYHLVIFIAPSLRGIYQKTCSDVNRGCSTIGQRIVLTQMSTLSKETTLPQHNPDRSMKTHCILTKTFGVVHEREQKSSYHELKYKC